MTVTARSCEAVREGLEALHYGDLEGPERAEVEAHLGACAACRAALEAVRETAASLDTLPIEMPNELEWARFGARLEARVAPLRAQRMASRYVRWARVARVAAAFLIGGLTVLAAGLYAQTRTQEERIAMLTHELANAAWEKGDLRSYQTLVRAAAEQAADPTAKDRLQAAETVKDENVAKMWALARQVGVGEDEGRKRIAEFIATYPKEPLADQAFIALKKKGRVTLPPLEPAVLRPIPTVPTRALPGETLEQTYRKEIAKKRSEAAVEADPRVAAFSLLRAGQIAEENLKDRAAALELYREAARLAPEGKIRDAAKERAEALTGGAPPTESR